jgi:DNA replication protein DnaC
MLVQNMAHQALTAGHTVLLTTAGQLLGDLAALDSDAAPRRRLHHYARPQLLAIDEIGYLSYSNRHADLRFELISRRYINTRRLSAHPHRRQQSNANLRFFLRESHGNRPPSEGNYPKRE